MAGSKSVPMACTPLGASNCWAHQWLRGHHLQKPSGSDGLHESAHQEKPALTGPGSSHFEDPSVTFDALANDILCKHLAVAHCPCGTCSSTCSSSSCLFPHLQHILIGPLLWHLCQRDRLQILNTIILEWLLEHNLCSRAKRGRLLQQSYNQSGVAGLHAGPCRVLKAMT